MSRIASARRGRKQHDRNDDFLAIKTDCRGLIDNWLEQHPPNEGDREPEYNMAVFQVGCDDWPEILIDGYRVASGVMKKSPVSIYELKVESQTSVLFSGFVRVHDDMPQPIDLLKRPPASPEEVRDAIAASKELAAKDDNEPAPTKSAAPEYCRISREEDPVGSRLGFQAGSTEKRSIVIAPSRWHLLAFHNPSAQIVGRISVSADISEFRSTSLELAIFTATGEQLFRIEMRESDVRFDDVRLPGGELLVCYRAPRGAEGHGSYDPPFSRILTGELPVTPQLDELILGPQSDGDPVKCGVPLFKFSSREAIAGA